MKQNIVFVASVCLRAITENYLSDFDIT